MIYLIFIFEIRLYLPGIPSNVKPDFAISKSLYITYKMFTKFLLNLGTKGNLITTNLFSSNNHFGINSYSLYSLNFEIAPFISLAG